jgi:hypothetical protein
MLYFYDLEKPGTFGVPNRILLEHGSLKLIPRALSQENRDEWDPHSLCNSETRSFPTHDYVTDHIGSSDNISNLYLGAARFESWPVYPSA